MNKILLGLIVLASILECLSTTISTDELPYGRVEGRYDGPGYNGCGSRLTINPILAFIGEVSLIECCNTHDLCYGNCSTVRKECDDTFLSCMLGKCSQLNIWIFRRKCTLHADQMGWAVKRFGERAFNAKNCTKSN